MFLLQRLLVSWPVPLRASSPGPQTGVTLSLGGVLSQSRSFHRAGTAQSSGDFDLEANYRYFFLHANIAALAPAALISSWVAIGGGYAFYQQSAQFSNGQNTTNKLLNRGILDFGGGVDYALFRFLGPRAEVRDLVSGNPDLNVALSSSTQHNVISSGGMFVRC